MDSIPNLDILKYILSWIGISIYRGLFSYVDINGNSIFIYVLSLPL